MIFGDLLFAFDYSAVQPYLPYVVGCGVASGVLATLVGRRVKRPRRDSAVVPDDIRNSSLMNPEDKIFGDRRAHVRREGHPVPVHCSSPAFKKVQDGWVLDRSTGGLRIALDVPTAPGTAMQVIAVDAPDTTPWVTILVRSCKQVGKRYELGCEFEHTPPWGVLLPLRMIETTEPHKADFLRFSLGKFRRNSQVTSRILRVYFAFVFDFGLPISFKNRVTAS